MVAHTKRVTLRFDAGVNHLVVKKLCMFRRPENAPLVVVEQPAEEAKLALLVQHLDLHEITELAHECVDTLFKARHAVFDLCVQQHLHAAIGELCFELIDRPGRVAQDLR